MSSNTMTLIEKLSGRDNYPTWKFSVQTYLEHEELWDCVESSNEVDVKKDTKAKSKIILLVDPINYIHIQQAKTAKEVWDNLAKAFDDKGLTRRVGLLRDLITTTLDGCQNIEDYVNRIMSTALKLRNIGFIVNNEWLGTLLLAGLPDVYQPMIMGLESSGLAITADLVKTKLLQDIRKSDNAALYVNRSKINSQNAKQTSDKSSKANKGPRCFICNKYGHVSKYCRSKKKEQKSNENSGYVAVFSASMSNDNGWYVDLGASMHLTMHRDWLYDEIPPLVDTIKVADDKKLTVKACEFTSEPDTHKAENHNSELTLETSEQSATSDESYHSDEGSLYEPEETIDLQDIYSNVTTRSKNRRNIEEIVDDLNGCENAEKEETETKDECQGPSHAEAFEALEIAFKWFERQEESDSLQLLQLMRIRDLAALKRCDSLRQRSITSYFQPKL
ncbi:uncharacterized protein LOC133319700 [Danaus plexippus]|uniref:uncharacterized protein LOC133319700 n=1 Tax=Danaus plexippus TaxID=13037 RepID=UPI002AB2769A|nr:uncharacterized protein LOC133319700 [Danaus plexippus]